MKNLKKVGFAASLLLASSFVSANNSYALGTLIGTSDESTVGDLLGTYSIADFTDTFTFNLAQDSFFSAVATSTIGSISSFNAISLITPNIVGATDIVYNFVALAAIPSNAPSVLLSAGTYDLQIGGTSIATTGYTLNTNVSPVPEPSAIALMLGGLGLVGFMAARRRKQNA